MFDEQDRQYFYNEFKSNGYEVGSYDDFKKDLNNKEDRDWYYNEAKNMGYDVGTQADFDKMVLEPAASASPSIGGGKQVVASAHASKPQVAQPVAKPKTEYPQEVLDAYNSPDNKPGNFKDLAQLNDEYQRGELKKPGFISQALGMMPKVDAGNIGREQKVGGMIANMLLGDNMQQPQQTQQPQDNNQQVQQPAQQEASPEFKEEVPVTAPTSVVNNEGLLDAKLANYLENWKQRPDKQGTYFENMVADLLADGTANSNEEAVQMVQSALGRYANRSAMDVTNQVVASLPDDTVQDAERSIEAQWYSHGVQDKLKQEADSMGISYDDYVAQFLKPAMVQSLVNKYGPNYRDIAEGIATRLYSHDEHVQDRLMNQDINDALSSVISKYVSPSVVDEYNKAQEAGSKAFTEGMEGSQYIPANLRLGTALGAQYEANEAKDPAKVLSGLQKKFGNLYRNPEFLNDMSNAAFKVMQRYGLNGGMSGDPKQFKPMINSVLKNELDQLEIKGMMPKGSAEYIMKTGLGNTIVGKITRKAVQTDYQNWLEDMANQQYQPGFWENVASGALTFAGDAWSYWLPGAAGGKLTKSMIAKAEGKLAGDLMAKGMERKVAERAAKVLIGKSKDVALKNGAVHGAVTFGGQSAISKPIDEVYRTGQFDENGKIYNPSVGKVIANTLGEVAKQTAVGAIMQGGTIANMIGKGRGLATNILADVGGKVVDSGIMTGQQLLERMAQDPNFKPTGKDAAESFLESMANLTAIGLPGMVGKYARFKDAREFNKKYDFTDQDIAELKRFGYDGLRDAFEKVGIGEYAVEGESAQRLDGQLTQKYMDLMNDKSVPEVLKAKMMAVVEGKRPSSFSPVVDSVIVQPMDHDGKVYLETLNKNGGIIDRQEYSSLAEAQKADKKLEYEKTLGLASVLEGEFHNEFTQEHLDGLYNKAAQKYNMGEKLTDEDKAAVYLHQNAGAIKDIMDKQQKGIILTEEEQKQVDAYRHYYDSALENSSVMREFVNTFEDSHGVARGTLRKALESKDKKYAPLVESYLKELYNSIELKREMKQTMDDLYNTAHGNEQKRIEQSGVEGEKPATPVEGAAPVDGSAGGKESAAEVPPTEPPTPPVEGGTPSNESKPDAYVMGQNAYQNGDAEGLKAIDHNDDVSKARLKRAFSDDEAQMNVVVKAYEDGNDMEQFVAQRANYMTPAQQDAVRKYVEAQDAKNGVYDALQHADDGYGEALKEQLWPYQTEDGNIVPATLTTGQQVFLKKANEYGGGFVVVPDEQGQPTIKQVSSADIKEVGTPIPLDEYINQKVTEQVDARYKQFRSQFDGSGFKRGDIVSVSMEAGDEPSDVKIVGYTEDGRVILTDTDVDVNSQIDPNKLEIVTKDEFNSWRQNAIDSSVGAELDAEDAQRANDDAAKAEADKKQRYNEGIVGLGMGQPDYSSKDTEPKVAAEYLQEQFGNDHGKLMNLISGSRSDIKEQLDNKRKAASEYEDWLSLNADLDPEKAQKVEDELSLVNEQIADLDARFKNWNTIRNSVMTPDEVKAMKEERKAEVEKAGVDETAIVPSDDFHVLVLDDKELKKQYPTMDEASDYIASQRKDIYQTQEDVEHKINDVNGMLEQYINGETELDPTKLMELNTTKAQLEALQTNLSVAAKGLKAQANKLSKLYKTEVSQQEMEELGMNPSEQRKALVADALKKNDLGAIKEIYKDSSVDVTDLTPQTLEEAVSESLRPHSLNPESLQDELGKSNFKFGIGKGYDSNKFNYLIAKKGTGMSVNDFAVKVYNDLPVNLQDMGYNDQDVRNALLDMFKSYDSVKEMRNVALMNRIAAAEDELSSEEEYYEAQKEREIIERQAENPDYYAYLEDNSVPLPTENELNQIAGMEYDRMMEIEDREREYKQYVKSILPELADYDDRSNEEGYGGGSSLDSDSSRRGVDEGNRNRQEGGSREASAETETGALHNSTGEGRQEIGSLASGEGSADRTPHLPQEASFGERLKSAIAETETEPTEAQKKAGNYKKGHLSFGGYDYTVETPKGVTRSGKDEQGKPWSVTMHDTYGYILGTIGVDGDHIDMFINDSADLDTFDGNVYVVDQVNPETGEFDEHKVMYGYPSEEAATEAYLANYSKGWKGLGKVTAVSKATFDKWLESSDRKTKPFAEYAMVQKEQAKTNSDFIAQMEYDYENDIHPSEEDKPKMQKFVERLLNFHSDKEDKIDSGYTILSSNIRGDKLYPNEKKWFGSEKYRKGVSWVDKQNNCAYEVNPRFNNRGYLSAVGVHKIVPLMKFDRDVKEVKPSEMTEAQKVAYEAVSTMLKKAGIPVKVVSNEDMEKVAEAQDNLNLAMLLNHPEMRFKIKTPEEKQAAENAYNFAKELRPNKWAQYAVVDMSNPNKMPEYYQKQELARKERTYLNRLMWGNYKVFNLDKSFEDNVAGLTGSFPSEFDPYKIDEQTSKKNELKKQIKETEEAYKLTGQERVEYQNQLMKEYMDEHGLASENDIPDDVWNDCRNKSFEKYQDKLDSLFAKYKDLDRQLKAVAEPGVQYLKGKGVVYGYTDGKEIVLNQEHLNPNTPIHEYQHLWRTAAKEMNPELIEHGDKLIMQTQLFADLKENPNYNHLSDDEICDEAFAHLTGEDGAAILEQMAKDAIKENPLDTAKELTIINRLKDWLKKFWYWTLDTFTKWKPEDIKKMTLEDIRNLVLRDLANGVDPRTVLNEKKAKNAEDADKTLVGVHNISEDKLLKAIKQGGLANPSVAVIDSSKQDHKAYGDISLILPSDKVAKRTGKNAGTWQGDAYTPTYPQVERHISNKGSEQVNKDVLSVPKEIQHEVRNGIYRWLDGNTNSGLKYLFLHEKGNAPKMVELQHKYSDKVYNDLKSITAGDFDISSIGKADAQKVLDMYIDNVFDGDRTAYDEKQKYRIARYKKQVAEGEKNPFLLTRAKNALEQYDKYGFYFDKVQNFVRNVERDHRMTGVNMDATLNEVEDYIKTNNLTDEFNTWLEGKEKEYGIKEVIFDGFTPSGNRRYVPNTLENVSKIMKKQGRNGATGAAVSFQNFAARLMPSYGTLKDIRSKKGLLTSDREKFDKFREKWSNVFFELGMKCQPDATGTFDDYGLARLSEAAMTRDPQAYLKKEYNVDFSDEDTKRLKKMVKAIKEEHPAMYFETKFERPVGFDEFSAAVVPTTTKKEVKEALKNAGVSIFEYDEKSDADRKRAFNEAINSNHEIRFHRVTEPEELERLNKEKTFRMYSGMQEVDGKLYSPMAAIIDGKRTDATEIGAWMGADERPDLVKGGKFQLVKTDKNPGAGEGPVRAAYNPYMHTSTSMMNDQFTGAYARGNIKVVEWEIPESEKTSGYRAEGAKDAVGLVPWHSGSVNGLLPKDRQRSVMLSRWRKAVRVVPDSEVAESIAEQLEGTGLAIPWNVVTPNQVRELVKLGVPITTVESGQQAPETKEKFLAQMEELKKEFPQAQFVDVKMTKDAFKEWGVKNNVKLSLGDTVPFVREQRSINNAFNDALDKQIAGTLPKGYNYQLGKPSSALKFAGIEDLPIELSSRTLEVKSSKDYKSNHPFDLNSVKNLPVAIQRPVAIFDSEYEDGRKVILTELKDGKGHSIIAVLGLRKLRGRNYAEVNSIISLYGKDSSVRIANWFDSKNPNGLGLDKNLCRWADTKKASEWLTNNASNVHSVGLSLKRIAKVINSFENNQFSEENLLLKHNFGDILGNSEGIAIENMRKVADSVVNTANKLGGAEATVYSSLDDVPEEYRSEVEQGAKGWYDPETHTVHVYLPNCADANEAERTVLHEKIGHEGMEVLLGGENEVRKFANFVYRSAGKDVRGKIIDFANKYDPDWKNNDRINVGTQEYIAHLAEEGPKTAEDFSLWTKIKHYLIKLLKKLGVRVPGLLNDKDLRYYLMKAGKALHVWDEMPREKQEALMKQASNAEIKDALGDGAGKGKPRQKKGESAIQYMKRVMEWKRWKEAREDTEDPEPPMFYDFDKDAEGKKEWERLNKEWRDSHGLRGEEMPLRPERKEGESDDAFMNRYKEWEKWNDAMGDKENPMPDMFSFEKQKQDEARQKYEDWLTRHELNEQNDADLDLYEGKIYPAETNPEADALEQRVMQDLAEVTSTDVSKEGAAKTVKHAVIHRRKNMEEASADDAIYINDVKNRIEKMADSGVFDKLLSDYKGKANRAEKLAEAIPYIIEAPRRLRDLAHDLNATGAFDKGHIHIQPADVEDIQPYVADLIAETGKKHTELRDGKEVEVYDDPQAVSDVASKMAQVINDNHQGEEGFVPIDGTDILSEHVLPLVKQQIVPKGIDYKNLSPEMKSTIDSIRDWYNYTYDWLKDNHTLKEDTGYNVDYVNHIWDKEKSDKQAYAMYVENRQRTKSPNEKPRTISTLMEGISVGLVPKTTDITKMMAYYSRSNIEAWANKTMLQEVSGLNVIKRNENGEIVSSDPLLSSMPPFNLEQYQYFEIPGVGPVWVYNESPNEVKVKNPVTGKENVLYREASAGDRFGVVFETYQSSPFWKAFDTLASSAKKLELGFSGFHALALTEVYMVQNMAEFGPKKAMDNFMKYIFVDTMKNHQLPCFANPEDFQEAASHLVKFGATNDYAAADVQNLFDNLRDFAQKLQKKLEERGNIGTAAGAATIPFEIATQMVSMLNKGMDVALWDFIHDGLKLASYRMRADRTKERAKKYGWTNEQLSKALDEDGQFVNDMFGGQHWDILGVSQRTLRIAGRYLLSPDWNVSTTRHFMAMTGFGTVWNEASFDDFKNYYNHVWAAARGKESLPPEYFGRKQRQISALICYFIGFLFYEAYANAHNAAFRAMDEEKERKKAEEIRKTNPNYKSMYELAYPNGMMWYDYLMRGNSLGQQSKIFLGRYADGTEMYIRHGKQFREIPEYFFNEKGEFEIPGPFVNRLVGKANPLIRMVLDDYNYLSPYRASHSDKELQRKYGKLVGNESLGKAIGLLHKNALYWAPFLIPSQENKEFKAVDIFLPSSKGFSPWKAQSYFKDFILSGDMEGIAMAYLSCERNGIDPEAQIKAAIGSVKALESAEMQDGVTSLQEASKRFDAAKSITEKKKMRQKMKKFLSQSDYKAFTQKEALDMVQSYLNGEDDLKEMEKAENKYLMKAKAEDVTEDWRIQNVWNGTMETYQEYQRLKEVDKAKANAFKNSKTNKRLFAARKAISAAKKKMNKAKKQMDGQNDAAKLVEIRKTRKELLETLNGME